MVIFGSVFVEGLQSLVEPGGSEECAAVKGWLCGGCGAKADNAAPGSSILALTLNLSSLHSHGFRGCPFECMFS